MKPKKITKAVFPVAGLGTRFLPATKSIPKEIMTLVDRPLIQYAIDEARAAGIKEFIFVTSRGKSALEDYFDHAPELAGAQGIRSADLLRNGIVDQIVPEHPDAADEPTEFARRLGTAIARELYALRAQPAGDRYAARLDRYRRIGLPG